MFDMICLWTGRIILIVIPLIVSVILLCSIIWRFFLRYMWYTVKRLVPGFWCPKEWIEDWEKTIKNSDPTDWRASVKITVKGRFFHWYCPKTENILNHHVFGVIKK